MNLFAWELTLCLQELECSCWCRLRCVWIKEEIERFFDCKLDHRLHLMEEAVIGDTPYPLEGEGGDTIDKPEYRGGKVFINKDKAFHNVPQVAWEFYIGGYQPAQKWLKDRKGRALGFDDILHYQKIIKILTETDRVMQTIHLSGLENDT